MSSLESTWRPSKINIGGVVKCKNTYIDSFIVA